MNIGDFVENVKLQGGHFWRGKVKSFEGMNILVADEIGNEALWYSYDVQPVRDDSMRRCVPKSDVGKGEVFRCVTKDHLRIFGSSISLKGSFEVMEKVAMRIVHVVDGHDSPPPHYDEKSCVKCRMIRAFRKSFWAVGTMSQEGIDHEAERPASRA